MAGLTKIPKTTVYDIVQKLQPAFWVSAIPNLRNLGLTTYDIFSEVNSLSNLHFLEKMGRIHPYIYYFARIYGKITGIYFQFRSPIGSGDNLELLFRELKFQNKIENFSFLHFSKPFNITPFDLRYWSPENYSWNFEWKKWFQISISEDFSNPIKNQKFRVKSWIQRRDIALLNKLVVNARRPNTKLKEELRKQNYDINDSTLSRRRKKLETEVISGYKVQIDPKLFDIVNTVLIWGYGPEEELKLIHHRTILHPIPFYSVFNYEKFTIYWYLHLPTHQLSDLLHILQEKLYELHFVYVDYPKAEVFSFDPDGFNEDLHEWNQSVDFIVHDVLKKINKEN
ncbi:hypothetical protein [Candidatus Harpocratesius sp.]